MSLRGIPLDDVLTEVMELSEGNHDITVPTSSIEYIADVEGGLGTLNLTDGEHPLTTEGYRTLMRRLSLPARYMSKLAPGERSEHVNMWLRELDTSWFLRLNGQGAIRSVQASGFTPVDILPTLETMAPVIAGENMVVTHHRSNLDLFHLRAVWPESYGTGQDPLHAGFHMNGSESGRSPFTLDSACYRNTCLNTAILRRGRAVFYQRHSGLNFDEFRPRLLEGLERVRVVGRNLCAALIHCRQEQMTAEAMRGELQELLNMKVLPKRFAEQCDEAIEEGRYEEATRFGLVNLITREAQEFGGEGDRRFSGRMRIEHVAGKMLLPYMTTGTPVLAVVTGAMMEAQEENTEDRMRAALGGFPEVAPEEHPSDEVPPEMEAEEHTDERPPVDNDSDDDDLESLLGDSGGDDALVPG